MRTIVKIVAIFFVFAMFSCDDGDKNTSHEILQGTQWKVLRIIEKGTSKETKFPEGEKNFKLIFRTNGRFKILKGCNYSFGTYKENDKLLNFNSIGPGTEMYCLPISDFEDLFIKALTAVKSYTKNSEQLILQADKYDIILEYAGKYDVTTGKVLFCTNFHILNCISEIEISVNGKKIGKITSGSQYNDEDCVCLESAPKIGEIFAFKEGKYNYTAKNTKCTTVNTTNKWSGSFTIKGDNCMSVFLDVRPK